MNKKIIFNAFLFVVLIVIIIVAVRLDQQQKAKNKPEEQIKLRSINYGSEVNQLGYEEVEPILDTFINSYNEKNGQSLVAIMDMVGEYIYYAESNKSADDFDKKYEEILGPNSSYSTEELILLQYDLQGMEQSTISEIEASNVELSVVEYTKIEEVSKYIATFTAKIRTVSVDDGIDEVDDLQFILLKKNGAYYIIDYMAADENGTIEDTEQIEEQEETENVREDEKIGETVE